MIERRIKAAKFPATKSLDSFDFKAIPSLNKPLKLELTAGEFQCRRLAPDALTPANTVKSFNGTGFVSDLPAFSARHVA